MSGSSLPYPFDLSAPGGVDALLAFHRSVFGGARMEADDEDGQPDEQQGEQKPPEKEPESRSDSDGLGDAGRKAIAAERKAAREEKRRADEAQAQLDELRRQQMTEQERAVAERDDGVRGVRCDIHAGEVGLCAVGGRAAAGGRAASSMGK